MTTQSLAGLLAQQQAKLTKQAPVKAKVKPKHKTLASLLRGTGFRADRADRRSQFARLEADESHAHEDEIRRIKAAEDAEKELAQAQNLDSDTTSTIKFDPSQQEAIEGLKTAKYGCLIGPAGSGKTTTERELLFQLGVLPETYRLSETDEKAYRSRDSEKINRIRGEATLAITAFTGKAVQQTKRHLPAWLHPYCDTTHGWLGYGPEFEDRYDAENGTTKTIRVFKPTFTSFNKLNVKLLILDEAGMMPVYLWNQLMEALPSNCRIFLIGDLNQIPPIHGRSILGYAMLKWPAYELRKIHRTEEGGIIDNAHRVLAGRPVLGDKKTTAKRELAGAAQEASKEIVAILNHLYNNNRFDPMQDVCIVPTNVGPLGQVQLNEQLVRIFNPVRYDERKNPINPRTIIRTARESLLYAVGDKIMLLKNNRERNLTNGQVGVVIGIRANPNYKGAEIPELNFNDTMEVMDFNLDALDLADARARIKKQDNEPEEAARAASHVMTVKFQDVEEPLDLFSTGDFSGISLAYAMTCHKMQGSEARKVIVVLHGAQLGMLCREWYYTAITRARERLIVLHTTRAEKHAITAQRIKGRTLKEKAQAFLDASGEEGKMKPILPKPQTVEIGE